jgi:PAS domain S-box-containing protein
MSRLVGLERTVATEPNRPARQVQIAAGPRFRLRRGPMTTYVLAWVLLTAVFLLSSGLAGRLSYDLAMFMTAVAIVVGVSIYRPRARFGWYLLAATMVAFTSDGLVGDFYALVQDRAAPLASWYDAVNLTGYALLLAGVAVIVKARSALSRQAVLDAVIFVAAIGSAEWELLAKPALDVPGFSLPARAIAAAYPMVDVLLVGLLTCLLFSRRQPPRAILLLAFGMAAALVFDTTAAFSSQLGELGLFRWLQLGYMVATLFFGVAALHPSMVSLSERGPASDNYSGIARLVGLGLALLLGPGELLVQRYLQYRPADLVFVAVTMGLLVPLVMLRMWWLLSELRNREANFRSLVQNSSDLTLVYEASGVLSYVSPASRPILGLADNEMVGRPMLEFVHPEDQAAHRACLGGWSGSNHYTDSVHLRMRCGDGSYRLMEAYLTDLTGEPSVHGMVANMRDVTERSRLEAELRHAQKLESVGQLASGIAHEINTPIQFVGDNVRFLGDAFDELLTAVQTGSTPEQDLEFLAIEVPLAIEQTLDGVDRVARIVRAMKAFGHPGTDQKSPTDINEAVRNTLVVASNTVGQVADVIVELGDLPLVWCHPGDVNQVLVNLVINAAHAISDRIGRGPQRGTLTVRTSLVAGQAVIDVTDTGTGVPEEIAARLFEPFFTTKEVGRGTGQGLALAYALVTERHGGSITFVSELGTGTTFTVRLPIGGPPGADNLALVGPTEALACTG